MIDKETIYGQVVAKANNYKAVPDKSTGGRRIIKSEDVRNYEKSFARQCKIYRNRKINGMFKLLIAVYQKSQRYDLDNSIKTVLDCLQQVNAITNDSLCYSIVAEKRIDRQNPRIVFAIEEIEPRLL